MNERLTDAACTRLLPKVCFEQAVLLNVVTPERESHTGTNLIHPFRVQPGYPSSEPRLRGGYEVVEIHGACCLHAVFLSEENLGRDRIVDVTVATVTVSKYAIALSRVNTTTGLRLSGRAKSYRRTSPRVIAPATLPQTPRVRIHVSGGAALPYPSRSFSSRMRTSSLLR